MADTSWMARVGARLVNNGYAILPIAPGTKKPGQFARAAWHDYPQWNRHATRATTEIEVATWSTWPGCGVGIVGGAVAALDIDIAEDGELALRIERLARERLGDTPALRIGKQPKRLLVYRATEPFAGIRRAPLEMLCLGQQFVAYAEHPDTGRPYAWPDEGLADLDIESLPEIDAEQAAAFLDEALALIPPELRPKSLGANGANGAGSPCLPGHAQAGTLAAIRSALAWLPNAELDYDSWVRIGMALKGALGDAGAPLFADWSAQAAKNDPAATAKAWASFKPERIGAGTIYHLAMEKGWRPDPDLLLDGSQRVSEGDAHPAAGLLARLARPGTAAPILAPASSFTLTIPNGLVGDLARHMIDTARRPQPLLAVGASLCALGALMGRRYRTETDLRTNLYIVGIADSGSGKNHAREVVNRLFFEAGLAHHLGGNKIASGAGLLTALHRQPAILFQIDEFGMFLSAAADRKRSPRHVTEILDNMTELYSAASGVFLGAEYANRDGSNERRDIVQPCLCVYGTTTPLHFWGSLQGANVVDGSLARFIILVTDDDYPDENRSVGLRRSPPGLIEGLQRLAEGGGRASGNLAGRTSGPETAVDPMTVPMDDAAQARFDALGEETTAELRAAAGTFQTPILARIAENAAKVALVLAVGRDPVQPVIRIEEAVWAIDFVRHFARRTIDAVERHVADTETEAHLKRLREIIRKAGSAGLTKSELTRASQWLRARDRDDILLTLVESGDIVTFEQETGGRKAMRFRALR
ncbi:PriCT-2 domain-containing protein [Frigidibacter sp. ROC022]|uniref:PriCT-2 domain-containing protein n=1 Tax=Frigidibacter sp. ROC022 TaxID=2971796 RepID=UPI00215A7E76|nr:PriCT-2 domain-containing protein [Frigidibacter sp. ROC022]MCR8724149.1 PriCT-2 domain-containing protein [Frigidibacter sp. ROC022]